MEYLNARLITIQTETPTVKRLTLEVERPFSFKAGQWLDLFWNHDGHQDVLGLSICSAAMEVNQTLDLAIKLSAHPVAQHLHSQAQLGETFQISPHGMGDVFFLPEMGDQVVLIAGGIGVTPLLSIFRTVANRWSECQASLIYSAADPAEFAFLSDIQAICEASERMQAWFNLSRATTNAMPGWIDHQGRISESWLKQLAIPQLAHYYLCGPQKMLFEVEQLLLKMGVMKALIHYEAW